MSRLCRSHPAGGALRIFAVWVCGLILVGFRAFSVSGQAATVLEAADFGVVADGECDDGPAVVRMLEHARQEGHEVTLQFPPGGRVRIGGIRGRYLFPFQQVRGWTLDGRGCTFLLPPECRFIDLAESEQVTVRRLQVDFAELPFADGLVVERHESAGFLEVELTRDSAKRVVGGPTREDGEQAFFAMLWSPGTYAPRNRHLTVTRIEQGVGPGFVKVYTDDPGPVAFVEPGVTRISLPVPGVAHRYGPGPCFRVQDCAGIRFEDVELWSAPWFGFHVFRNRGEVVFQRVNIRPKPGGDRLMSLWRDGFHVKGNRARLLWEDCIVEGMCDDAFNIATHTAAVQSLSDPTRLELRQVYPLNPMPWDVGSRMMAFDPMTRRLRGSAVVTAIESETVSDERAGRAPRLIVRLDRSVPGLVEGDRVWQPVWANPDTVLRRCRIGVSCRMQSPMAVEECDVTALLWFCDMDVEGPVPSRVTVRDCRLRRGWGNAEYAVIFSGEPRNAADPAAFEVPRALCNVRFTGNEVHGGFRMRGVQEAFVADNRFLEPDARVEVRDNRRLRWENNRRADGSLIRQVESD